MDLLGTLLALVHDLNNGTPATVAKKAGLVDDVVGLFAEDSKWSATVFSDGAMHRVALEVAEKLLAWSPTTLSNLDALTGLVHDPTPLRFALVQAHAATAAACALLAFLPEDMEEADAASTGVAFRLLSACSRTLFVPAAQLLALQPHTAQPGAQEMPARQRSWEAVTLEACSAMMVTALRLLQHLVATSSTRQAGMKRTSLALLATSCKPEALHSFWSSCMAAMTFCHQGLGLPGAAPGLGTLCQLTVRLLAGPVPLHIPAWQWWHQRTSTLVQEDIGGICQTVSLVSYLHHYQVHALAAAMPGIVDEEMLGGPWIRSSALLRDQVPRAKLPRTSVVDHGILTADAVAAVQLFLRLYMRDPGLPLRGSQQMVLDGLLEALHAAAAHCSTRIRAVVGPKPGEREGVQVPAVCWEGIALCCTGIRAVLEREVWHSSPAGAAAAAAAAAAGLRGARAGSLLQEGLGPAMHGIGTLLAELGRCLRSHYETAVATGHVATAVAAVEAAARLCGRLWMGPEQLRPVVGSEEVIRLGQATLLAVHWGPHAIHTSLNRTHQPPKQDLEALGGLAASLAKLCLLHGRLAGFEADDPGYHVGLGEFMRCLQWCLDGAGLIKVPGLLLEEWKGGPAGLERWVDGLVLRAWHACHAAVGDAALDGGMHVLIPCAAGLTKLLVVMDCLHGLGGQASESALFQWASKAVELLTVASWHDDAAWASLAELLESCCEILCGPEARPAVYVVRSRIFDHLVAWASDAGSKRTSHPKAEVQWLQQQVLNIILKVAATDVSAYVHQTAAELAMELAGRTWGAEDLCQHVGNLCSSQPLGSRSFWVKEVQEVLLPAMKAVVAVLKEPVEHEELVRGALCLAAHPCANPLCTNLSGCSERHLRGRRCSGCQAVRYCSRECQEADFEAHAVVCRQLVQRHQ